MLRIGILGAAKIAPKAIIAPAAKRDDCVVAAVASRDAARAAAFAHAHGVKAIETDYGALIGRPDIDLVYNALPPSRHADLSIAALRAGKAVLCEKPFAMDAAEARAMTEASRETGRPLLEAFHHRFHPAFRRVLTLVRDGAIGAVRRIDARFTVPIAHREGELRHTAALGGGALMDLGCYPLHWARTIAGAEPRIVAASAVVGAQPDVDLAMTATLDFPTGAEATVHCSMEDAAPRDAALFVYAEAGVLRMTNPVHPSHGHAISLETNGAVKMETVDGGPTYDYQLDHVLAVMAGRETPLTGGGDAVANMAAIDSIYEAAGLLPRGWLRGR